MNWEEKFSAIKAAGNEVQLHMREPGQWCLINAPRLVGDSVITSLDVASYPSPQDAVEGWWAKMLAATNRGQLLDVWDGKEQRRVTWNGFMWRVASTAA